MEKQNKLTVIYSFKVRENKANDFIACWTALTKLIYEFEGSYGSRLHKVNDALFIAYAQWPGKEIFYNSGNKLPASANLLRNQMREYCLEIKSEFELESIVVDLLKKNQHKKYKPS